MKKLISVILLSLIMLSSCSCTEGITDYLFIDSTKAWEIHTSVTLPELSQGETSMPVEQTAVTAEELYGFTEKYSLDFWSRIISSYGDTPESYAAIFSGDYEAFFRQFGYSEKTVYALYAFPSELHFATDNGYADMVFTGDVNLADDWEVMPIFTSEYGSDLSLALANGLLEKMQNASVLVINNEFSFSDRGTPMENKKYTFRAKCENVSILNEIGVDLAVVANNHVYDYGGLAFSDTLKTLRDAGIVYVGAGENKEEAEQIRYFVINGYTVAFVAASRAEKYKMTPEATESKAGVLRTYDSTDFCRVIAKADENADFVIAIPHWGTENTDVLEEEQLTQAREYIDSGADAVIGGHTHCLQGIEYYNGCPVFYSLGNFWFNYDDGQTMLLLCNITDGKLDFSVVPCVQHYSSTTDVSGTESGEKIIDYLNSISINASVSSDGHVSEINEEEIFSDE